MRNHLKSLIREHVMSLLSERRRKKRSHKPGGPRTDMGALRQLHPDEFAFKVRTAVDNADGDVETASEKLDVAPRTLYHYLSDEPRLDDVKTTSEMGEDEK